MNPSQFDRVAKVLAERKLSRRRTLAAAGSLAALGLTSAAAQDATPDASPVALEPGNDVPFMFVQSLGAGSIDAATDGVDTLLLVADHLAGQTIFFSDRPERIVGMVPTTQFLSQGTENSASGFSAVDPPNAALVLPDGEIVIVELIEPAYDPSTGQVRYQLRVLEDVTQVDLQLQSEPLTRDDVVGEFTAASLFIDDCPDGHVVCWNSDGEPIGSIPGNGGSMGFCWSSDDWCCRPCESPPSGDDWNAGCDYVFGDQCGSGCGYSNAAGWSCAQ